MFCSKERMDQGSVAPKVYRHLHPSQGPVNNNPKTN
jgi:hypothetical protein